MVLASTVRDGGETAERELATVSVPALWLLGEWTQGAATEAMASLDALRASGRPFAYHVMTDADQRDADTSGAADIGSVVDEWMHDGGLR